MSGSACSSCGAPRVGDAAFCFQCGSAHSATAAPAQPDNPSFRPIPSTPLPQPAFAGGAGAGAAPLDMSHPDLQRVMAQVRFDREWDWGALLLLLVSFCVGAAVYVSPAAALFAIVPGVFAFLFYLRRRRLYIPYKGSQMAALAAMVALTVATLGGLHTYPFKEHKAHASTPTQTTPSVTTPAATTPGATTPVTTTPAATGPAVTVPSAGGSTTVQLPADSSPTGP